MISNKIMNKDTIESVKFLLQFGGDEKTIISSALNNNIPTPEFIEAFYNSITPEMFTLSYKLPAKLVDMYSKLFNEELFLEKINGENWYDINIHATMLERYVDKITKDDERLEYFIRSFTEEEINEVGNPMSLFGISETCDKLLYMKVKDEDTINSLILLKASDEHSNPSFETFKHMSDDMRDMLLGNHPNMETFLKAFASTNNFEWKIQKLNELESGSLTIENTTESYNTLIASLIKTLPEDLVVKFIKTTSKIGRNLYNEKILLYILDEKNFAEDELIELIPIFKNAGLIIKLKKLATSEQYNKLLDEINRGLRE